MADNRRAEEPARLGLDFWKYFTGQLISTLGTSFTLFAIPLLIFKLTGSALNLGLTTTVAMLPYVFFGLVIGAWVDRLNRRRLMILVNIALAISIASIPFISMLGHLSVGFVYVAVFVSSTLGIFMTSAEFAAIPSLVGTTNLVLANGRIQASYSVAQVIGPILAGLLISVAPIETVLWADAGSYLVAATALFLVRRSFNAVSNRESRGIRHDVADGLRYVVHHPILRNISIMSFLFNFFAATTTGQLVFFAKTRLHASNGEVGWLFSAAAIGVVALTLAAGRLRRRWSFSQVALTALASVGLMTAILSLTSSVVVALPVVAAVNGFGILYNVNTMSLRQTIVPNEMLGRAMSIAAVAATSASAIGALVGGVAIQATGNVAGVYGSIGVILFVIPIAFAFTALGRAGAHVGAAAEASAAP